MPWWRREKAEQIERRTPIQEDWVQQIDAAVRACRNRVEEVEGELAKVQQQFRQLRGYVYVRKGLVGPEGEPPPGEVEILAGRERSSVQASTKDELRRTLLASGRILPGKPTNHSE